MVLTRCDQSAFFPLLFNDKQNDETLFFLGGRCFRVWTLVHSGVASNSSGFFPKSDVMLVGLIHLLKCQMVLAAMIVQDRLSLTQCSSSMGVFFLHSLIPSMMVSLLLPLLLSPSIFPDVTSYSHHPLLIMSNESSSSLSLILA